MIKWVSRFRLKEKQSILLADKLFDLANFFAIGFVITRLLDKEKDLNFAVIGFIIYILLVLFALWLSIAVLSQ